MAKNICGCDETKYCGHTQAHKLERDRFQKNEIKKLVWNNSSILGRLWLLISNNQPN